MRSLERRTGRVLSHHEAFGLQQGFNRRSVSVKERVTVPEFLVIWLNVRRKMSVDNPCVEHSAQKI